MHHHIGLLMGTPLQDSAGLGLGVKNFRLLILLASRLDLTLPLTLPAHSLMMGTQTGRNQRVANWRRMNLMELNIIKD